MSAGGKTPNAPQAPQHPDEQHADQGKLAERVQTCCERCNITIEQCADQGQLVDRCQTCGERLFIRTKSLLIKKSWRESSALRTSDRWLPCGSGGFDCFVMATRGQCLASHACHISSHFFTFALRTVTLLTFTIFTSK